MNHIAFDLDNTIIDYRPSLHQIKLERDELRHIDARFKEEFKGDVVKEFGNDYWTELQGHLYTDYVKYSKIDLYFVKLLEYLRLRNWQTSIISHKTEFPYLGPKLNMRECALKRLQLDGIVDLVSNGIHFFDTKIQKIDFINSTLPNIYVDDLIEILELLSLEGRLILFDPVRQHGSDLFEVVSDWKTLYESLKKTI